VLLGYNFIESYTVGDTLNVENFFLEQKLEIVGFLASDTTIFYQFDLEYSLDDYIIVPFPPNLLQLLEVGVEEGTVSTLAHVMLNADIIIDSSQGYTINSLIELIGTIARRTGYEHYVFMGIPIRISQLASMVSLVYRTHGIIICILILSILLTMLVLIYTAKIYFDRSRQTYLTYLHCGADEKFILRLSALDIGMPLVLAFIISFSFLEREYRIEWVPLWAYFIYAYHYISAMILVFFYFLSSQYIKRKVINL